MSAGRTWTMSPTLSPWTATNSARTARCPSIDPDPGENTIARGRASVRMHRDPLATAAQWRAKAEAQSLSIRELIIEVTGRQSFAGSPATVAGQINNYVQAGASDGYILVPPLLWQLLIRVRRPGP